jgi:hypothetical protein
LTTKLVKIWIETINCGPAPLNTCPVKFRKNERCGFIGVSWKWSPAYLTGVGSANRTGVENWLIFSLLDLLNYLNQLRENAEKNAQDNMQQIEFINKNNFRKLNR